MAKHVFCRELSLERGEPLPGTGNVAQRSMLVAWPRGKWRLPRFESVDMGPALADAIRLAMRAGIHVALVDRVGETGTLPQLQADGIAADFDSEIELAAAITRLTAGEPLVGRADPRKVILCCTDSRRDACCARFGFATYKALVAAADPEIFHIVQATHIGGCRFAASLVLLPQRQRYGRVEPEQAAEFLATLAAGQIYLPAYRGRAGLPETAQVAEHAAMVWADANGLGQDNVRMPDIVWPSAVLDGDELSVTVTAGDAPLQVHLRAEIAPMHGNCEALVDGDDAKMTPRWRLAAIHPLA